MKKRTENEVIKDFEKLGYRLEKGRTKYADYENSIILMKDFKYPEDDEKLTKEILIRKNVKAYECYESFYWCPLILDMQEHKLLNELFELWGWL